MSPPYCGDRCQRESPRDPHLKTKETPSVDFTLWRADFMRAKEESGDAIAVLKRFGALALQTPADTQEARRNMIAARLYAGGYSV